MGTSFRFQEIHDYWYRGPIKFAEISQDSSMIFFENAREDCDIDDNENEWALAEQLICDYWDIGINEEIKYILMFGMLK